MNKENIEDIYRLTPTQEGMLFHTLESPQPGIYCEQFGLHVYKLDRETFIQAWRMVQDKHPVLRSSFHWEGVQNHVQIVWKDVSALISYQDLRDMNEVGKNNAIDKHINEVRLSGFELTKPPLMRLSLLQTGEESFYLNWTYHHMILDGWSAYIVLEEILTIYDALCQGMSYSLEERRAFKDYVTWVNDQDIDTSRSYWSTRLQGIESATGLPLDKGAEHSKNEYEKYQRESLLLSKDEKEKIDAFLKANHLTLNTLVQGVWALIQSAYSGEESIVHGSVVSGRPHGLQGSDRMVGLFINTLPVRIDVNGSENIVEWMRSIQMMLVELRKYESTPLSDIQKWSDVQNGMPLFDSLVAVETYPVSSKSIDGFDQKHMQDVDSYQRTNYALTLWVEPGEHLFLALAYDPDRFDERVIKQLLNQFKILMLEIADKTTACLHELCVLSEAEKKYLIHDLNRTEKEFSENDCVHELFEQTVNQYPNQIAVRYGDTVLTYKELNEKANQLAIYLREQGIRSGDLVGISVDRSHYLIIAMLASLKACGAYVPIDPEYPQERIEFLLKDSRAKIILTQECIASTLGDSTVNVFKLDKQWKEIDSNPKDNLNLYHSSKHIIYTIYTSGSTGIPKGASVYHYSFVNLLQWYIEEAGLGECDKVLLISSPSFDLTQKNIFAPLLSGSQLILQPGIYDPEAIINNIRDYDVALVNCTPSSFYPLVDSGDYKSLASLKHVVLGGEPISMNRLEAWQRSKQCHATIINSYGPTECTDVIAYHRVTDIEKYITNPIPLGKPINNTRIYLLDGYMRPVPAGVPGEICIAGIPVGRGYLNSLEKTDESFLPDPYSNNPEAKMYKTGDIGLYNESGEIEFLGRTDHQVKVRGFRIELGEIESEIEKVEWIKDVIVDARPVDDTIKRLVAYLTVHPGNEPIINEVKMCIKNALPAYMEPAAYVVLDEMPLTPSGKVDRKALPEPESSDFGVSDNFIEPKNDIEKILHDLWCDVLSRKKVSITDNFFNLGGDSILSIQLISRAKKHGLSITPRQVFKNPTILELAKIIKADTVDDESYELTLSDEQETYLRCLDKSVFRDAYPLSPTQQGMLFHSIYSENSTAYFSQFTLSLEQDLNVEAFKEAWQDVVSQYDSLNVCFVWDGIDLPLQIVGSDLSLPWMMEDWSDDTEWSDSKYKAWLDFDRNRGFDFSKAPLMRMTLIKKAKGGYEFIWSYHHILLDGWSVPIIIENVFNHYQSQSDQGEGSLKPKSLYKDYIGWLQNQDIQKSKDFWKSKLSGFDTPTSLGIRATTHSEHGFKELVLTEQLTDELNSVAVKNGLTLNTLIQGAWSILLSIYSGQKDIVYGSVVSGRPEALPDIEAMVGLFLNTLPVRLNIDDTQTVIEWMSYVQNTLSEIREYEYSSLSDIQSWSEVPAGINLFESIIAFENTPLDDELKQKGHDANNKIYEQTNYPLSIKVFPGKQLTIQALYNETIPETAAYNLLRHFEKTFQEVVVKTSLPLKHVSILLDEEINKLLYKWNDTRKPYPDSVCVHQLFEDVVDKNTNAIALLFGDQVISYAEMNKRANQIAHHLRDLGVGSETLVGISMDRSPELIIGLLAILKAGGAYVPVDPSYPAERKSYMLNDAGVDLVLTQERYKEALMPHVNTLVFLDGEHQDFTDSPETNPENITIPSNTVYVVYTSGSTGKPKGVVATHQNVTRLVRETGYASLSDEETYLQLAPIAFDASTFEIWGSLLNGAKLAILEPGLPSVDSIGSAIEKFQVSILWLTTGLFNQMVEYNLQSMTTLKQVLTGGDVMSTAYINVILKELPQVNIINFYGPTENTTFSTFYNTQSHEGDEPVPIGKCINNSTAYILNDELMPVPVGVVGELYVGGDGVARGYLNKPALTAEKFIPDRFSSVPGSRLYRTGDIVRYLDDGNIEFIGRVDNQVKIRGFRIELPELESVLAQHTEVVDNRVLVKVDDKGHKRLVSYLILTDDAGLTRDGIRHYLAERLPSYMVPSAYIILESFPVNANGKLDSHALPEPKQTDFIGSSDFVEPQNEIQKVLVEAWKTVLKLDRVGIKDNFFELGGDSILTIQMISQLKQLDIDVEPKDIFECQSIDELSKRVKHVAQKAVQFDIQLTDEQRAYLEQYPVDSDVLDVYPLSPVQQGMLFHSVYSQNKGMYINQFCMKLPSDIDIEQFKLAWHIVVNNHDSLRTSFIWKGLEAPLQIEHEEVAIPWDLKDWSSSDLVQFDEMMQALLLADRSTDFTMDEAPLIRMTLVKAQDGHYEFIWSHHHILIDGWSMPIILSDLFTAYNTLLKQEQPVVRQTASYKSYIAWLQQQDMNRSEVYWSEQLAGFRVPTPLNYDSDKSGDSSSLIERELTCELTDKVQAYAKKHHLTVNSIIQGAWGILLSKYSSERDVVFGSVVSGRSPKLDNATSIVGLFLNTLPTRVAINEDDTLVAWLKALQKMQMQMREHEYTPLVNINAWSEVPRGTNLFESIIAFENTPIDQWLSEEGDKADTKIYELSNYPLTIKVFPGRDLKLQMIYTDRFNESTIARLLNHYVNLISEMVSIEDTEIDKLQMMGDEEKEAVIYDANDTEVNYPKENCLHQLFEKQVKLTPDAIALVYESKELTYSQLNSRANQLAHYLRRQGAGPETKIGICMERSIEMVVALLGIIKAGAAYVPLDPDYPEDRLLYMIDDIKAHLVITQKHLEKKLESNNRKTLCLNSTDEVLKESVDDTDNLNIDQNIAYVIYTSGSTGKPKGVMNTHYGIRNRLLWMQDTYRLTEEDRVLQKTSFSFDVSVWEFFWPLITGATLVMAKPGGHKDSTYMVKVIQEQKITTMHFVPPMLQMFMHDPNVKKCTSLRQVICSGEALPYDLVERFYEVLDSELHNLYGPTEAAIDVTEWDCKRELDKNIIPIGYPISNTQIHILDRYLQPVPVGVTGELYIGGENLSRGYFNKPSLTAEKFIPNPFSQIPSERLYRTGDLARYLPNMSVEFLGRIDHQVKVRGFRIELGEIESALILHEAVNECVLLARDDSLDNDKRLVAYVVLKESRTTDADTLKTYLRSSLPDYMVPSDFVIIDAFPLTQNGKIDRRALPAPVRRLDERRDYVAPRNNMEKAIAKIWMNVLEYDRVGVTDSFFDLGGHSMLMMRVNAKLNNLLNREIELVKLFEYPTIEKLASYLQEGDNEEEFTEKSDSEIKRMKRGTGRLADRRSRMKNNKTTETES